jgi:hypothetical protein
MQQFTIPQFIDVEDKIIGPITTRQFVIMLAGFMLIAGCYKIFDFALFVTVSLLIFAISAMFAFVKINGRPFHLFALNVVQTMKRSKLRVWNHKIMMSEADDETIPMPAEKILSKHYSFSRLTELSLIVDTGGEYKGEAESGAKIETLNI